MRLDELHELHEPQTEITPQRAQQLRARIAEHAPGRGGRCAAPGCGVQHCEIRADAIGRLIIAGQPWLATPPQEDQT